MMEVCVASYDFDFTTHPCFDQLLGFIALAVGPFLHGIQLK